MKQCILLLLIFSFSLLSCKNKGTKNELLPKNLSQEEIVQEILSDEYAEFIGLDPAGRELLYNFYEKRAFKPLWSNKKRLSSFGESLVEELKDGIRFGISSERNKELIWADDTPIQNEIVALTILTRSYFDLKEGYLDSTRKHLKPIRYVSVDAIDTLIDFKEKKLVDKLISWGVSDTSYQLLASHLYQFATTHDLQEKSEYIPTQKEDSLQSIFQTKKVLIAKNYILDTEIDSLTFVKSLKKFQLENGLNPDGLIGENTVKVLMETARDKAEKIAVEMEKLRWKNVTFPKRYVHINLPEYMLRFYDDDTLRSEHKIVIGKPAHATPELTASIYEIVVYPFWNVPYSIASKEILPALKNNPNYLARNKMRIFRKNIEVDPSSVNWKKIPVKTFPYSIKQDPGSHNSLGILKFEFYNKYDVYVHDTPQKSLFNTVARAYSHGCMRAEYPIELAKSILERDKNVQTADSLDTLINRVGENYKIKLKKRIPIIISYKTVVPQGDSLVFYRDVYGKNTDFIVFLFGKKEKLSKNA